MSPRPVLALLALLFSSVGPSFAAPETYALADPIDYSAWSTGLAPMNAAWQSHTGSAPVVATGAPSPSGNVYFKLHNGVATVSFQKTLTHDLELSFDALHTSYSRQLWVGFFNDAGTEGYAACWDSSSAAAHSSQGFVRIKKYALSAPSALTYNHSGAALGASNVASGHNIGNTTDAAITAPFARIRLTWRRADGELRLYVDDVLRQTAYDTDFNAFSRLFAGGYSGTMLDNVAVRLSVGADTPFTTHEAESPANATTGTVVSLSAPPTNASSSPELEASGRAYVELSANGHYLDVPVTRSADALTLRHCIPDATSGGGTTATLSLYVNGVFRQTLNLGSDHNWLYGAAGANGQSNDPADGEAHVFWAESRHRIEGAPLAPGDTLRLRKDSGDTAAYYRLDLLDLELVPAPRSAPPSGTFLSVDAYGADGSDALDDTTAIKACIAAAKAQGKIVWIPSGTYLHNQRLDLDGVKVRGAGVWHTELLGTADTSSADFGFRLSGNGAEVGHLFLENTAAIRRGSGARAISSAVSAPPEAWLVEHVWIRHAHVGFWMSGATDGVIRHCRVHLTYADAVNINSGASGNLVEHTHVRGAGDDGLASLAESSLPASADNVFRRNTAVANWWGHNADLAGGSGHVFENNLLADNAAMGVFTINHPGAHPMHALTDAEVRGNVLVRGGGRFNGQIRGSLWIYTGAASASAVSVADNQIVHSLFRGLHLVGASAQHLTFARNHIEDPGAYGVLIEASVNGSGTFLQNTVLGATTQDFRNNAGIGYVVGGFGNSW